MMKEFVIMNCYWNEIWIDYRILNDRRDFVLFFINRVIATDGSTSKNQRKNLPVMSRDCGHGTGIMKQGRKNYRIEWFLWKMRAARK